MPIPPDATAIHHITNEMVADAPDFSVIGQEFIDFCDGDVILIAHNNDNFDVHFLRAEFSRHGITIPQWNYLDTLKWARRYRSDLPRHSLQFLREIYGISANNAHRALDDVVVLHRVFMCMIDDLSIDDAFRLMNQERKAPDLTHMPFGKHQGKPLNEVPKNYIQWLAGSGAFDKPENESLQRSLEKLGLLA
jgi:DNA polymerase-3 subunit epsilon